MYHLIEFAEEFVINLEISPKDYLEMVIVPKGAQLRAEIRPYVMDSDEGLLEVADLFFEDGTATRGVRFDLFSFVEN